MTAHMRAQLEGAVILLEGLAPAYCSPVWEALMRLRGVLALADQQREQLLSTKQVCEMLAVSYPTIWRMIRRDQFPKSIRISPGRVGWRESDIAEWLLHAGRNEAITLRLGSLKGVAK